MQCDLIFGILKCTLPKDLIEMDLKVCTLGGIHTYRKDRSTQIIKCSPWRTEVQPYPSLKKKMVEFMKNRQIITTPFANRSFQPRPKVAVKKHNLVPLTRLNRAKISHPRKINVGPLTEATQQNWAATLTEKPRTWQAQKPAWPPNRHANPWTHHPCYLHYPQSSYKIYRTFQILSDMYSTGKNIPYRIPYVIGLGPWWGRRPS